MITGAASFSLITASSLGSFLFGTAVISIPAEAMAGQSNKKVGFKNWQRCSGIQNAGRAAQVSIGNFNLARMSPFPY